MLLGKIVRVATGKRIDAYAEEVLFEPPGITGPYWKQTPDGEIATEGGLYLSAWISDFAPGLLPPPAKSCRMSTWRIAAPM